MDLRAWEGELALGIKRLYLDTIERFLPPQILVGRRSRLGGSLKLGLREGDLVIRGALDVTGVNVSHPKLASDVVKNLSFQLDLDAAWFSKQRQLVLSFLDGRMGDLSVRLYGEVSLPRGELELTDGSILRTLPKVNLNLEVPKVACNDVLSSLPRSPRPPTAGL